MIPDIKDVKPPVDFPANYFWIYVIIFILAISGIVLLIRFLLKKNKAVKAQPAVIKQPWEIAYEQLAQLEREGLLEKGRWNEYFSRLADIVRRYFEGQFLIKAPEMTTEEFLIFLKQSSKLTNDHKDILKEFLNSCDMVKFAKYTPDIKEAKTSFDLAKRVISETKT